MKKIFPIALVILLLISACSSTNPLAKANVTADWIVASSGYIEIYVTTDLPTTARIGVFRLDHDGDKEHAKQILSISSADLKAGKNFVKGVWFQSENVVRLRLEVAPNGQSTIIKETAGGGSISDFLVPYRIIKCSKNNIEATIVRQSNYVDPNSGFGMGLYFDDELRPYATFEDGPGLRSLSISFASAGYGVVSFEKDGMTERRIGSSTPIVYCSTTTVHPAAPAKPAQKY
jgi:hypothetical protein